MPNAQRQGTHPAAHLVFLLILLLIRECDRYEATKKTRTLMIVLMRGPEGQILMLDRSIVLGKREI